MERTRGLETCTPILWALLAEHQDVRRHDVSRANLLKTEYNLHKIITIPDLSEMPLSAKKNNKV